MTTAITSDAPVSLVVFATKVEELQSAKRRYFALRKNGRQEEVNNALKDVKDKENSVDALLYEILHNKKQSMGVRSAN